MSTLRLLTAKGALTPYAFACGYVETSNIGYLYSTNINQRHGVYFVTFTKQGSKPVTATARNLTAARKLLATLKVQA